MTLGVAEGSGCTTAVGSPAGPAKEDPSPDVEP